jgi:hypothetical protein
VGGIHELIRQRKGFNKKRLFPSVEVVEMLREYSNGSWEDVGEF